MNLITITTIMIDNKRLERPIPHTSLPGLTSNFRPGAGGVPGASLPRREY